MSIEGHDFALEALRIARTKIGVREDPPGSNSGVEVREYLRHCVRDLDRDGDLDKLGLTAAEWCAAFACWCSIQAKEHFPQAIIPHEYRASGIELIEDAQAVGAWHTKEEFLSGDWSPWHGDLVLWDRSKGKGWQRHVARLHSWVSTDWETFRSVGGNEENEVRLSEHSVHDPWFLGFISYFQEPSKGSSSDRHPLAVA